MSVKNKVVVITGASSGIGEATAKLLAKNGAKVVLGARRDDKLQEIQKDIQAVGGLCAIQKTDVTKLADVRNLAQTAIDRFGSLDVWVNNAGVMLQSEFIDGKIKEWDQMVDVNIKGVLNGIDSSLETFRAQGSGQYINLASVAGLSTNPGSGVYSATKAAVRMISDALRQEEAKAHSGVRVTVVSPGAVQTELTDHITDDKHKERLEKFYKQHAISPNRIADVILYAINQPKDATMNEMVVRPTAQG